MANGSSWYSSDRWLEPISALVAEYNFIWLSVCSVLKLSNVSAFIGKTICAVWLSNYNRVARLPKMKFSMLESMFH